MPKKTTTKIIIFIAIIPLFVSGFFIFLKNPVFASSIDGTVDSGFEHAWTENVGWLNFGTTQGNVHITDTALSGYAWGENIGWVSLNCSNDSSCLTVDYKVANDGEGNLSGYAWSENAGWINFDPAFGGVTINASGEFSGYAWGENIGWIVFNCANTSSCLSVDYKVKTDWCPISARICTSWTYSAWSACVAGLQTRTIITASPSGCSGGSPVLTQGCSSGGGGGSLPPDTNYPPTPPEGGFIILINNNDQETSSRNINLSLLGGPNTTMMVISNSADFSNPAAMTGQIPYQTSYDWDICKGLTSCPQGNYTVYVKFYTQYGYASQIISHSITYKIAPIIPPVEEDPVVPLPPPAVVPPIEEKPVVPLPPPAVKPPVVKPQKPITELMPEILQPLIPDFLKPQPPAVKPPEIPIAELLPKEAPLCFQGNWQLLAAKQIREFVLAPLPEAIRILAQKFPTFGNTLEEVGISKITDVAKLKSVALTLPGLTERVGLPIVEVEPGKFVLPQGVPIAKLTSAIKQELPAEIVFAKTGGELIDFNIALSVSEKNEPLQKISTISGMPLQLVVKPDQPVKSVKGYVVFKSKIPRPSSFEFPFNRLTDSLLFARPAFAQSLENPVRVEEKLVLQEFEYTDPDGDGIYTAEIQAPVIEGEYEIITVMDYEEPALAMKEIRLITVVDPEGYVFEKEGDKETRIPGAIISLFWLNPETKQYELWPAKEYQQANPQTTDVKGTYSFLVPEGFYYLKIETPGYLIYDGKPFQVKEGSGIHINVELKTKYWWLKIFDWKTILLIVVIILLLYNFYRDKVREKPSKNKKI